MLNPMINVRVRIWGHYKDRPFVYTDPMDYGSQYYNDEDDNDHLGENHHSNGKLYPLKYIWRDGNYSCDCNRSRFIGLDLDCGHCICIDFIQPLEHGFETLCLFESLYGVFDQYAVSDWGAEDTEAVRNTYHIEARDPKWGLGVK